MKISEKQFALNMDEYVWKFILCQPNTFLTFLNKQNNRQTKWCQKWLCSGISLNHT